MKYILQICLAIFLGQVISSTNISAQEYHSPEVTISKEKVRGKDGKIYYMHIVKERQTIFSIAKAYHVRIDDIYKINPNLQSTGLKNKSIILIPIVKFEPNNEEQVNDNKKVEAKKNDNNVIEHKSKPQPQFDIPSEEDHVVHKVKWYENLHDIAKKYNISVEELMIFNHLDSDKVKSRTKLFIPNDKDLAILRGGHEAKKEKYHKPIDIRAKDINLSLVLPFFNNEDKPNKDSYDFYAGVLLAIKNNKSLADINLNVYDCSNHLPIISQADNIVIGPISLNKLYDIEDNIGAQTILVSPLDSKAEVLAKTEDNFVQIPPAARYQNKDLILWLKSEMQHEDKVINISENNDENNTQVIDSLLNRYNINYIPFSYDIMNSRTIADNLSTILTKVGTNRVVINSDKEGFIIDVIRNLNVLLHKKYKIVIYCNSKVKNFETIDIENLHSLNTHICTPYFIDYNSKEVKDFVMQFRALYNTDPSRFAFQGYDIAKYFIELYYLYSSNWAYRIQEFKKSMLQSNIQLRKLNDGGYINIGMRKIVYNKNFTITLFNTK